jgi:hypothetical protein
MVNTLTNRTALDPTENGARQPEDFCGSCAAANFVKAFGSQFIGAGGEPDWAPTRSGALFDSCSCSRACGEA